MTNQTSRTPICSSAFLEVTKAAKAESEDWDYVIPLCVAKSIELEAADLRERAENAEASLEDSRAIAKDWYERHEDLRERLAELTMSLGFATGHGDTAADILKELEWQIEERLAKARAEAIEECARVCDRFASRNMHPAECAGAIRALAHPKGEDHGNG